MSKAAKKSSPQTEAAEGAGARSNAGMSWEIRQGDSLELLADMDPETVQTVITSPPYWGLRDYGHPGQLGLEATPGEYVARLVEVFREVRRVLKPDGTLWLNLGDSYAGGGGYSPNSPCNQKRAKGEAWGSLNRANMDRHEAKVKPKHARRAPDGLKPKDMVGIPWRVALALQADGWWLRSDIIWHKPACMPSSVKDRPTTSHEYLFLMTRSPRYFYDAEAIKEPSQEGGQRNKRSVWTVAPQPFSGAHFAVMPPKLVEPCIKAGSRPGDLVLDPFSGAATVGVVARRLQRSYIGLELNPDFCEMGRRRIAGDAPLFNRVTL